MEQRQPQQQAVATTTVGTTGGDDLCTCCAPPNKLIINPRLGQDKRVCPQSGHVYEDRGDGVWQDTNRTVGDVLREQPAGPAPGPALGARRQDTVIDPGAGDSRPSQVAQTGTQVDLRGDPFALAGGESC